MHFPLNSNRFSFIGVISCRATNSHGQVQSSCTLIVKEEKGLVEGTQLPDTGKLEKIKTTEKHRQAVSKLVLSISFCLKPNSQVFQCLGFSLTIQFGILYLILPRVSN